MSEKTYKPWPPDPPAWFLACMKARHDFNVLHRIDADEIVFRCVTCARDEHVVGLFDPALNGDRHGR